MSLLDLADAGAGRYREVLPDTSEPVDPDYSHGYPVARHKHTDELIKTPVDGTTRIGIIGESGCGKTTGIKRYVSVTYDDGFNIMNGADAKNDFHGLDRKGGVSKQLREAMGLLPGEQPHPVPVQLFQPLVLSKLYEKECSQCGVRFCESVRCPACESDQYRGGRPSYVTSYSLRFNDLNKAELTELVNPTEAQRKILDNLLDAVGLYNTSFPELIETLEEWLARGEVSKRSARSLRDSLEALHTKDVINNRTNPLSRVFQDMDEQVVSLSIQNRNQLPAGSEFANIVKLHIVKALEAWVQRIQRGELQEEKNLWIGDECHEFIPAGTDDQLLRTVARMVNRDARQCDMGMIFSTQQPSQLPNKESDDSANILGSLTHCFIGKSRTSLDESEWKPVLKSMNVYRGMGGTELKRWRNKFSRMEQNDFVYINAQKHRSAGDCPVVRFLSPKMHHGG